MAMAESGGFPRRCWVLFANPAARPALGFTRRRPSCRPKNEHIRSSTPSRLRPLKSILTGVVRNHPIWTVLVHVATRFVGSPRCVTIFIDVRRNHPPWTDLVHLGPRDWEPVTTALQALWGEGGGKAEPVQVRFTLCLRWMQDGCTVYMDYSYMASNGSCIMVTSNLFKIHFSKVGQTQKIGRPWHFKI